MQMRRGDSLPAVFSLRQICQEMMAAILHSHYFRIRLAHLLTGWERKRTVLCQTTAKPEQSTAVCIIKNRSNVEQSFIDYSVITTLLHEHLALMGQTTLTLPSFSSQLHTCTQMFCHCILHGCDTTCIEWWNISSKHKYTIKWWNISSTYVSTDICISYWIWDTVVCDLSVGRGHEMRGAIVLFPTSCRYFLLRQPLSIRHSFWSQLVSWLYLAPLSRYHIEKTVHRHMNTWQRTQNCFRGSSRYNRCFQDHILTRWHTHTASLGGKNPSHAGYKDHIIKRAYTRPLGIQSETTSPALFLHCSNYKSSHTILNSVLQQYKITKKSCTLYLLTPVTVY